MYRINIQDKRRVWHSFDFSFRVRDFFEIDVENICIIRILKLHNHRYDLKCFFYETKNIFYLENIRTKKDLYNVVQNLLQKNLYGAVQFW